jgi:hypothetical protein
MGNWESNDWGSQSHDGYWGGVTLVAGAGWLAAWRGPPRGRTCATGRRNGRHRHDLQLTATFCFCASLHPLMEEVVYTEAGARRLHDARGGLGDSRRASCPQRRR